MVDAKAIAAHLVLDPTASLWMWPPVGFWGLLTGSGTLAIAISLLRKFRQLFYVYRFEHADTD